MVKPPQSRFLAENPATLLDSWNAAVSAFPEKIAVADSHGIQLTYAEADKQADKIAAWLHAKGVTAGEVVSCQLPGWAEFLPIYIATLKLGAIFNPIAANLRQHELRYMLTRCKSRALFLPRSYRHYSYCVMLDDLGEEQSQLKAIAAVDKFCEGSRFQTLDSILASPDGIPAPAQVAASDDLAVILFTSGSEQEAKGVMFSHRNILAAEAAFSAFFGIDAKDHIFMPAPPAHAIGFHHGVTLSFLLGASVTLMDKFEALKALDLIKKSKATLSMATTAFLHDLMAGVRETTADFSSLRFFLCGGSPPHLSLVREANSYGLEVLNVYGSTESVPHMGTPPDATPEHKARQALFPMPGIEVRIVDREDNDLPPGAEGEELSRSDAVFIGYLGMEEATRKSLVDGWFHSGDLCRQKPDGSYEITGRIKDIIVRGGENISCLEVENILRDHPAISEVAVIGMPDERLQERVCAYVVLKQDCEAPDMESLRNYFINSDISLQKCPERLEIRSELPRTNSGKVHKGSLVRDLAAILEDEQKRN